jgi:tRNA-modifying protein YgfZ
MNIEWTQFLQAHPEPTQPVSPSASAWVFLDERTSLHVSGEDAGEFLQAMLTQEILLLDGSHAARGALCNAKGRISTTMLIHPLQPTPGAGKGMAYRLTVPTELAADLLKALKLYVLRRRVVIDIPDDWLSLGLLNPDQAFLTACGITTSPMDTLVQTTLDSGVIATWEHADSNARLSLQGPAAALLTLTSHLPQRATQSAWDCAEIHDGIPTINRETVLHFVPQWINLDQIQAVSFKKGCYPGQEVIARLHYLGKSNRRMVSGYTRGTEPIRSRTVIHPANDPETEAGEIVRSAICAIGNEDVQVFLAVMRLNHLHDELVIEGHPCTLQPGPFLEVADQRH